MRRIVMLVAFGLWTVAACAQESGFQEGVHYKKGLIEQSPRDQVEVIEFFSYACSHCAAFAPYIHRWEKNKPANVKVTYIPVVFHEKLLNYAKAHYTFDLLGVTGKAQPLMFEAIHVKNLPLDTPEQIADLVAGIGVDKQKFLEAMNSFAVDNNVRNAMQRTQKYRVSGVPSIAVNGKYTTDGTMAGNYDNLLKIIDHLVQLESKPKPVKAAAEAPKSQ